jgi:tetratricopeptide (TPR) repeat protein
MAVELMPDDDERRPRLLGRLSLVLAWALDFDEAVRAASEAGDVIAASEGADAAADYLAGAAETLRRAGSERGAWALAPQGLRYIGDRRDQTWVWLKRHDITRREAEDAENLGIPVDTLERDELFRVACDVHNIEWSGLEMFVRFTSREEVLARVGDQASFLSMWAGEYRRSLRIYEPQAAEAEGQGRIARAVDLWANVARCHNALGDFTAGQEAYRRARALAGRLAGMSSAPLQVIGARYEWRLAVDDE